MHKSSASQAVKQSLETPAIFGLRQKIGGVLGPLILLLTCLTPPPDGLTAAAWMTIGIGGLMATWWVSETIPIPATSLLPMVLFPLLGIREIRDAAAPYANPIIFLFLGGFLIALAMERWNLHRRIALHLISSLGTRPSSIVGGFMLASAALSMWVSNTATTLMMLPIALSVIALIKSSDTAEWSEKGTQNFSTALLLAVAYAASIGGLGTLIGTPPNALLAAYLAESHGITIGFGQWMMLGVPVVLIGLPIAHQILTRIAFPLPKNAISGIADLIETEKKQMGSFTWPEYAVAIIFVLTATAWIFQPFLANFVPYLSDTGIALIGALVMFAIPASRSEGTFLLDWNTAKRVPWDVLLLFGGGLSLASALDKEGVASWLGQLISAVDQLPILAVMALTCIIILLLTELTSNTATAAAFFPVVAAVAVGMGESPLLLLIPAALAASCSFMMPVGTPPNAVVFGSGQVTLPQMVKAGVWLNIAFLFLIMAAAATLGKAVFGA